MSVKCLFEEIYETKALKNPKCHKIFETRFDTVIFCKSCRPKVAYQRYKLSNYGREHIKNTYKPKFEKDKNIFLFPILKLQEFSVNKIAKLGKLGKNFNFIPYHRRKK